MKKLLSGAAATVVAIPLLAMASPVFADSPGQLMGGSALYQVKNITQNGSYDTSTSASCNETVQYSIELHNTEFGKLTNVAVKATLPGASATTSTSTVTASATDTQNNDLSVTGSVTVNLSQAGTMSYQTGTTKLFDGNGKLVKALADGITTNGLNLGDLNGSTGEFVNFQAKVSCTPPAPTPTPTPKTLPNTGPGQTIGLFAIVTVAGAFAHRLFLSRKLARQ